MISKISAALLLYRNISKKVWYYITTWQEVPDDNQKGTTTTKPEWFNKFENKQEQRWKEQHEFNKKQQQFNQQILGLIQSLINRVEDIEHRLDKLESIT